MNVKRLSIPDIFIIEPDVFQDDRGLFFELFKKPEFLNVVNQTETGDLKKTEEFFLQDNVSVSKKNVIRGLHFQIAPYEQGKLVTVIKGAVLDVAVDIRKNSSTFGKHVSYELSDTNRHLL